MDTRRPRRTSRGLFLFLSLTAVTVVTLAAQTPDKLSFDVVSIKANPDPTPFSGFTFSPAGRFSGDNVSVHSLIQLAFGGGRPLANTRIAGDPDWARFEHFNIGATVGGAVPKDEAALMKLRPGYLRGLLEDYFKLKYHWESRPLPIATLTVDRKDGRLGPSLQRREAACATPADCDVRFGLGLMRSDGMTLRLLAENLSTALQRVVIDRTGLDGVYKLELHYVPESFRTNGVDRERNPNIDPNGPSIQDAVRDQLGLKLELTTGPVDVLVIDSVARPTLD